MSESEAIFSPEVRGKSPLLGKASPVRQFWLDDDESGAPTKAARRLPTDADMEDAPPLDADERSGAKKSLKTLSERQLNTLERCTRTMQKVLETQADWHAWNAQLNRALPRLDLRSIYETSGYDRMSTGDLMSLITEKLSDALQDEVASLETPVEVYNYLKAKMGPSEGLLLHQGIKEFREMRWSHDIGAEEYVKVFNERIRFIEQAAGERLPAKYKLHMFILDLKERDEDTGTKLLDAINNDWKFEDASQNLHRAQEYVKSCTPLTRSAKRPEEPRNDINRGSASQGDGKRGGKSSNPSSKSKTGDKKCPHCGKMGHTVAD